MPQSTSNMAAAMKDKHLRGKKGKRKSLPELGKMKGC